MSDVLLVASLRDNETESTVPAASSSEAVLFIRSPEELRNLARLRARYPRQPLVLQLSGLSDAEATLWSEKLNGYRNECGCSLGAGFMFAGFLLALLWDVVRGGCFTLTFFWRLPIVLAVTLGSAGIGKAIGLLRARQKFNAALTHLLALSAPDNH